MLRYKTKTRPGLVALYDIRPGNAAGQFLQPRSPHRALNSCDECRTVPTTIANPQTKPPDLGCESACRLLSPTTTIAIYSIFHLLSLCMLFLFDFNWIVLIPRQCILWLKQAVTAYSLEQHMVTAEEITVNRGAASKIELICTKTQMM